MQLKQFYNIATKVSSRKKCYYFWWSTWLISLKNWYESHFRITSPLYWDSIVSGGFRSQMANNAYLSFVFVVGWDKFSTNSWMMRFFTLRRSWYVTTGNVLLTSPYSITSSPSPSTWSVAVWFPNDSWSLQWRHDARDGVSNHQRIDCLHNRLFKRRSTKTSKLRVTCLFVGNSPVTGNSLHKGPVTRKMVITSSWHRW